MLFRSGLFRGVQVPENLLDEPLDSLPYWDRFYRYLGGEYRFTGESPTRKNQSEAPDPETRRVYEIAKPSDPAAVAAMPGRRKAAPKEAKP